MRPLIFIGVFLLMAGVCHATLWTAYNDVAYDSDTQSIHPNATAISCVGNLELNPTSGSLLNIADGSDTGADLTIVGGDQSNVLHYIQGSSTLVNDAQTEFGGGEIDMDGLISYSDANLVLNFTSLNDSYAYDLILYVNRDNPAYGTGQPGERNTEWAVTTYGTIGANDASAGMTETDIATTWGNVHNTDEGRVYKWSGVTTDGNGNISLTAQRGSFHNYLNGFKIVAVPEPSTLTLFGLGGLLMLLRRRK